MSNYMQVPSLHMRCRNAEGRFKKILLRALFSLRCCQNDSGRLFRQQYFSSVIAPSVCDRFSRPSRFAAVFGVHGMRLYPPAEKKRKNMFDFYFYIFAADVGNIFYFYGFYQF